MTPCKWGKFVIRCLGQDGPDQQGQPEKHSHHLHLWQQVPLHRAFCCARFRGFSAQVSQKRVGARVRGLAQCSLRALHQPSAVRVCSVGVVLGVVSPDLSIGEGTISPLPIYLLRAFRLRMALPSMLVAAHASARQERGSTTWPLMCLHPPSRQPRALRSPESYHPFANMKSRRSLRLHRIAAVFTQYGRSRREVAPS